MSPVHMDFANIKPLVYSLCEQRKLPVLVTDSIAALLDERDVVTISALSRVSHQHALPMMYNELILDLTEKLNAQRTTLLFRTLITKPAVGSHVRKLSLIGDPLRQWRKEKTAHDYEHAEGPSFGLIPPDILLDLKDFSVKEMDLYQSFCPRPQSGWNISLHQLCLDIINLVCHRLEALEISSDYFRYAGFRDCLTGVIEVGSFPYLRTSSFCTNVMHGGRWDPHINVVQHWDDILLAPFSIPGIMTIQTVMALQPDSVRRLRTSTLTRLTLQHCQIGGFDLNGLLAVTPRLLYLEYHASVDHSLYRKNWSPTGMSYNLRLDALSNSLHHVSDTLTDLVTYQKFDADYYGFEWGGNAACTPPFQQRHELSSMKSLRTLVVPYASLLGWLPQDHEVFDWNMILPNSIRHVTFSDDVYENFMPNRWDDNTLPVFDDLANWLAPYPQSSFQPQFTLRILQMETSFNEPIRQKLSRMFQEKGVSCTIEKLVRDRIEDRPRTTGRWRRKAALAGVLCAVHFMPHEGGETAM
jgi:hypothetical protein